MSGDSGDDELVLTPGGWRPKSKVHLLEEGHHVSEEGGRVRIIETGTGRVVKDLGAAAEAEVDRRARPKDVKSELPQTDNGWIEFGGWLNQTGTPIAYFSSLWAVPPAPTSDSGQLVYLFNGLMQGLNGPYILQPVLQWGNSPAGGGNYWAVSNWYVGSNGSAVHRPVMQVISGEVLCGVMTLTASAGNEYSYVSSFLGHPGLDLPVSNIPELNYASETLECYGVASCTGYPDAPVTRFYDIELKVGASAPAATHPELIWSPTTTLSACGQECVIVSNNNPGGVVDLHYH